MNSPDSPIEIKIVEETFVRELPILALTVRGQEICTTAEHPFYVSNKGWLHAGELRTGDQLSSHDGQWVTVEEAVTDLKEVATVYNLRVSDYHTYFVGSPSWGFAAWAHNDAICWRGVRNAITDTLRSNPGLSRTTYKEIAEALSLGTEQGRQAALTILRNTPATQAKAAQILARLEARIAARTARYGTLRSQLPAGEQANHLNQNAAFRSIILEDEGLAIGMRGNAFTEPGTAHYQFHQSLEAFWDKYRPGGALYGRRPISAQYGRALLNALEAAGLTTAEAELVAAQAAAQRAAAGLAPTDLVPRIPGRLNQTPPH
jgi:hypothetical protein